MVKLPQKIVEHAHQIAFLVQQYPDHNIDKIISLIPVSPIHINTALWLAIDLGFIEDPADNGGKMILKKVPTEWELGEGVEDLKLMLVYAFSKLAKKEQDLEENYVSNWTMGYPAHEVMIALKQLVNNKVLATYDLTDPLDLKSTYTFYTLYENGEQMWGRKSFAEQPTGMEQPISDDTTNNENVGDRK